MTDPLRNVDGELLRVFRRGQAVGIRQLIEALGVTATAVRQRLERLLDAGLIERRKVIVGRGRPTYEYQLTAEGKRCAAADSAVLAEAMWQEILAVADQQSRQQLLTGVARRLGRVYAERIATGDEASLAEKMRRLSSTLADQATATDSGAGDKDEDEDKTALPMLDIQACPYPTLRDAAEGRPMCQLEAEIFSEALGSPVELAECVLDGAASCHFVPAAGDAARRWAD